MVNPWAGEVEIVLDGKPWAARLTLGALAELEATLGAGSLVDLAERFEAGRFSTRDVLALVVAGLRGGGWQGSASDLMTATTGPRLRPSGTEMSLGFDWPGLLRAGLHDLGLEPAAFWRLTPVELRIMLGAEATALYEAMDKAGLGGRDFSAIFEMLTGVKGGATA